MVHKKCKFSVNFFPRSKNISSLKKIKRSENSEFINSKFFYQICFLILYNCPPLFSSKEVVTFLHEGANRLCLNSGVKYIVKCVLPSPCQDQFVRTAFCSGFRSVHGRTRQHKQSQDGYLS